MAQVIVGTSRKMYWTAHVILKLVLTVVTSTAEFSVSAVEHFNISGA